MDDLSLKDRLDRIQQRIENALSRAGRDRSQLRLVAVTKKFSAETLREAYLLGLRDFGENYVQEWAAKAPALADLSDARIHMIGHLQSNKANIAVKLFETIHTVDSVKLLKRLDRAAAEAGRKLEALLEVKLSNEESKTGMPPEQIGEVLEAAQGATALAVKGLMTMPPWSENAEDSRPYFQRLRALAEQHGLAQLSMGMSNDFEAAIEEGSTMIRVGTALFGARPKPTANST